MLPRLPAIFPDLEIHNFGTCNVTHCYVVPTLCLCLPTDLLQDLAAEMNSISVRFPDAAWIAMVTSGYHSLPLVAGGYQCVSDMGPEDLTIEILRQGQQRPQGFEM